MIITVESLAIWKTKTSANLKEYPMRLWSIHPKYLDAKGLVALWREALLAKNVLANKTTGYKSHPQLSRFRKSESPTNSINFYLSVILAESLKRGYQFDINKIDKGYRKTSIPVTSGQMIYETNHLKEKLRKRDPEKFKEVELTTSLEPHPAFKVVEGEAEEWEKIKK
jgi:hypothetical protein